MNQLNDMQIGEIHRLTRAGYGLRAVSRMTGFNRKTVGDYRALLNEELKCGCGREATHRGWCTFRFAHSENRQKFMADWVGWKPKSLNDIYWCLKGQPQPSDDSCYLGTTP